MMNEEKRVRLIARFEAEMGKVTRPGTDKLMAYVKQSDFYTAPASTRFHLSCRGGLLQHSLNVLDAMRSVLRYDPMRKCWEYVVAGKVLQTDIPDESVIIIALLHDICKTYFYTTSIRNVKNRKTGKWEEMPFYTVDDRMPLGHGPKSAMIIKQYISLTNPELYAIWHHMGFTGGADDLTFRKAVEEYPLIWATHTADMMASSFMEDERENKPLFREPLQATAGEWGERLESGEDNWANPSDANAEPEFENASPIPAQESEGGGNA